MKALQAQTEELQQMLLGQQVATTSAQVNRVSVKLPPFWKDKPWTKTNCGLSKLRLSVFSRLGNVTQEATKYTLCGFST